MKNVKTRKTILLALAAVLLCVYIVQLVQAGRSPIKEFALKEEAAELTIESAALGTVTLTKSGDGWTIGDKAYPADSGAMSALADAVQSVRTLGTVSRSSSEETAQRFGLDAGNAITVTAKKDGKALRTLTVGKAASTGDQTYVRIDGKSDIYMASGTLRDTFGKSGDDLRDKHIYSFNANDVTAVRVAADTGDFTATKAFGSDGAVWALADGSGDAAASGTGAADAASAADGSSDGAAADGSSAAAIPADIGSSNADSSKIASWITQVSSLDAQRFADDGAALPETVLGSIELTAGTSRATVTVAKIGSESADGGEGDAGAEVQYLCKASTSPYLFYVSKTTAERLLKNSADFSK